MPNIHFSRNNIDLIRLFAALQVAVYHSVEIMAPSWADSFGMQLLALFPGVPIFFFISGFLISRSYEKNSILAEYGRNRALRIFPALHVCVIFNLALVGLTGYFTLVDASFTDVVVLYLAKTTILQFYNPEFMRGFGDGVLNGSLWTICVELQFYVLVPLLYKYLIAHTQRKNLVIIGLMIISLVINRALYNLQAEYAHTNQWKLVRVSFLPWFYMFLFGVLVQRNFEFFRRILTPQIFWVSLAAYTLYAYFMHNNGVHIDNSISPLLYFPLACLTLMAAYFKGDKGYNLLKKNDISYGIYIYHMPVVNLMLYLGIMGSIVFPLTAILISIVLAIISWVLIEQPTLAKKQRPLHTHYVEQAQ